MILCTNVADMKNKRGHKNNMFVVLIILKFSRYAQRQYSCLSSNTPNCIGKCLTCSQSHGIGNGHTFVISLVTSLCVGTL